MATSFTPPYDHLKQLRVEIDELKSRLKEIDALILAKLDDQATPARVLDHLEKLFDEKRAQLLEKEQEHALFAIRQARQKSMFPLLLHHAINLCPRPCLYLSSPSCWLSGWRRHAI
jgi:hypothetical protein